MKNKRKMHLSSDFLEIKDIEGSFDEKEVEIFQFKKLQPRKKDHKDEIKTQDYFKKAQEIQRTTRRIAIPDHLKPKGSLDENLLEQQFPVSAKKKPEQKKGEKPKEVYKEPKSKEEEKKIKELDEEEKKEAESILEDFNTKQEKEDILEKIENENVINLHEKEELITEKKPKSKVLGFLKTCLQLAFFTGIFFVIIQAALNYETIKQKVSFMMLSEEDKNEMQEKFEKITNENENTQNNIASDNNKQSDNKEGQNESKEKEEDIPKVAFSETKTPEKHIPLPSAPDSIIPYDARIVIPKIGKNVPIVFTSANNLKAEKFEDLNNEILGDLQNGVIHYPNTALPGEEGNCFITGHSSYYPWDDGKYKDVFALLHELEIGDKFTIFYNQRAYHYKIFDIRVVDPKDVDVLNQGSGKMATLMTCSPVGTNLRRLVVRAYTI